MPPSARTLFFSKQHACAAPANVAESACSHDIALEIHSPSQTPPREEGREGLGVKTVHAEACLHLLPLGSQPVWLNGACYQFISDAFALTCLELAQLPDVSHLRWNHLACQTQALLQLRYELRPLHLHPERLRARAGVLEEAESN